MNTNFAKTYAGSLRLQHDASLYSVVSILLGEGGLREILLPYVSKTQPCSFYGQLSYGHTDHRMKTESPPPDALDGSYFLGRICLGWRAGNSSCC
uniref:Uncharacterized protein n=1 Tax=Chlamydia pneumoniae TaxID=83558 RepID=A0A0F7WP92_CHLPN|nr:hypothetical protein BN1224_DC9_AE_00040 [Chlamydia pneumoniae]